MIDLFGPSYRYSGERLTKPEIILVHDHHYDEDNQCFHIEQLMQNSVCNPQEHLLIFDQSAHEDRLAQYNHVCLPLFQAGETRQFIDQKIVTDWTQKTRTFNFMINKARPHRQFLLMLIEHFELKNYSYALPWQQMNFYRDHMKLQMRKTEYHKIVDETVIEIMGTNYKFGPEVVLDQGIKNGNFKNSETYDYLLKSTVFEPSCISLITEPLCFELETLHTEKTIMAMYGGTFPIWVGGWRLAKYAQDLGFDVFDDIIDHSYQTLPDAWDRCYYAVKNNLELLTNFDLARSLIEKNQHRLRKNIEILETNPFASDIEKKVAQYPEPTRSALVRISNRHRSNEIDQTRQDVVARLMGKPLSAEGMIYDRSGIKISG
jgi:hypothetical protein